MTKGNALICGGASGIGLGLARELHRAGYEITIADINEQALSAASAAMNGAATVLLDVRDEGAVERCIRGIAERGVLALVVNSVGIAVAGELVDATMDDLREALEINLMGTLHTTLSAYRVMAGQRSGTIVNVASGSGLFPLPARTHYTTTKFAVVGLTTALRQEAHLYGVKVHVVCPGVVKTPIFGRVRLVGPLDAEAIQQRLAANRGITPEQAARRILRGMRRNRAVITLDGQVRLFWRLWNHRPRLYEAVMRRMAETLVSYRTRPVPRSESPTAAHQPAGRRARTAP